MLTSSLSAATPMSLTPIVTFQHRALLLFLPQQDRDAGSQSVWRFDLDVLTDHAFRLTGRDGYYELSLTDTSGGDMLLGRFLDKGEAQNTLHTIHQALRQAGEPPAPHADKSKTAFLKHLFKGLTFWRVLALVLIGLVLWFALRPASSLPPLLPTEQAATAPGGVPLDADSLLPNN